MISESVFGESQVKMERVVEAYASELAGFRTGRASTRLLEDLEVDVYGSKMRLKELATLSVPEPSLITIQPWDKSAVQAIDKAIRTSDMNLSPVAEGGILRVPIPSLSEERRKELSKVISKKAEEARVSARNVRHDLLARIQEMKKKGEATEDEERRGKERAQKMTDGAIKKIDEAMAKKTEELQRI